MTRILLPLLLLGCATKSEDSSGGDSADTDTDTDADADADADSDTDTDTDTDVTCDPMSSGTDWSWNGDCPQMPTPCDIVVGVCSFTIDYDADGGMTMGMPFSGTIAGDVVDFENDNSVRGCTGTLLDADHIEGTCRDGCTFTLER